MATQKSIAKGVRANSSASPATAAVSRRRAGKSRSSIKLSARRTSVPSSSSEEARSAGRADLIEHLSAQLALVETASIALQKFEEQQEIGAICASLEHAVRMLASAHERVEHYLRRAGL
ncbi:MAG: hypothetical protein WDO56_36645 [Gammaproteobacteria bacterium]